MVERGGSVEEIGEGVFFFFLQVSPGLFHASTTTHIEVAWWDWDLTQVWH